MPVTGPALLVLAVVFGAARAFDVPARLRSGTLARRGWPFSSKNTVTMPFSSVSPMARQRITSVLPRSISTKTSSSASMP